MAKFLKGLAPARALSAKGALRLTENTYVIERAAVLKKGVRVPDGKDLIVGDRATVGGDVVGGGNVTLASQASVQGRLRAALDVIVGARAQVEGDVEAGGDVTLLDGSRVFGSVKARGRIRIRGGRVGGAVEALGDVEVGGESQLGAVRAGGRVRTLDAGARPEAEQ